MNDVEEYVVVGTGGQVLMARALVQEYAASLGCSPCLANIEQEFQYFPRPFAPPDGFLILALHGGVGVGVVGVKNAGEGVAEMARLYVRPDYRGRHYGRNLAAMCMNEARKLDYRIMRLHTLPSMVAALAMYSGMGFRRIEPYASPPIEGAVYMENSL